MAIIIRPIIEGDYEDILVGWWKDWGWDPPAKDFLPDNGLNGIMVLDDEMPVCAGFLYITNSAVGWVEWIISNKNYIGNAPLRKTAISMLVSVLTDAAKKAGCKYCYALLKHEGLIETYKMHGYIKGDQYTCEMIKVL